MTEQMLEKNKKTDLAANGQSHSLSLQAGDYLTRPEFERRYHAQPNIKKAELIEGIVYISSSVRADYHGVLIF